MGEGGSSVALKLSNTFSFIYKSYITEQEVTYFKKIK